MIELLETTDRVEVSFVRAVLQDAGVECFVFDTGAGSLWGAAIPLRVMVREEDEVRARRALDQTGRPLPGLTTE